MSAQRKNAGILSGRMTPAELQAYWSALSRRYLNETRDGFEVICYAGMPDWFNRFIHRYQVKGFSKLVRDEDFSGCRVLDIGTGIGRWARWYAGWPGARVVGIDIEGGRLRKAASFGGNVQYEQMSVDALAFSDRSFDVVNSITVLQHVPEQTKLAAIDELARVLRPGGRVVLFEITDLSDDAPHVFPWARARWRDELERRGLTLKRTVGQQYIPVLRLLKAANRLMRGAKASSDVDALKRGRRSVSDRARLAALWCAVLVSYPIEELCQLLPPRAATITGFLFYKT